MADTDWNPEEALLEKPLRIYAREHNDRFTHLLSPTSFKFKHPTAMGKVDGLNAIEPGFACRNHARASIAPMPTCPSSCPTCVKHFRPLSWQDTIPVLRYKDQHSDPEAASTIEKLVQRTRDNLGTIRHNIHTSGDALAKRWQKRSISKRAALLQSAMPSLKSRSDVLMISDLRGKQLSIFKFCLSLPYLNIEILSEDHMTLLALIHHRSAAPMSDWVTFDSMQIKSSFSQGALEASYNPHCVVMHGEDDAIGKLVFWNKDEAHRAQIIGYPLAKMILESQCMMSTFLLDMVNLLLQSPVNPALQGSDLWDSLAVDNFLETRSAPRRSCFRAAPGDHIHMLQRMLDSIQARHAANKDDARLLQTEPAFARQALVMIAQPGMSYTDSKNVPTMISYMLGAVSRRLGWYVLEEDVKAVLRDFKQQTDPIRPDEKLPWKCAAGLDMLGETLKMEFKSTQVLLRILSQNMGVFKEPFSTSHHPGSSLLERAKHVKDPAYWALDRMSTHGSPDQPLPELYITHLEHEMTSAKGAKRFNQTFRLYAADLTVLDEAIMALAHARPFNHDIPQADMELYLEDIPHYDDIALAAHVAARYRDYVDGLWPPLKAFLSTPLSTGKVNRTCLAAVDASHAALSAFWDVARSLRRELLIEAACPAERMEPLMIAIGAGLSPEYAASLHAERSALEADIQKAEQAAQRKTLQSPTVSPSRAEFEVSFTHQNDFGTTPLLSRLVTTTSPTHSPRSHYKIKVKTRPDTPTRNIADQSNDAPADEGDRPNSPADDRISVCPASMEILHRMYSSYGKHSNSNLRWGEFVKVMDDAGFEATWSTGGSAVVFTDRRGKGAIRLHQPHPDPTINPIMLRSFGKRMFRQFNWSIETFVEGV